MKAKSKRKSDGENVNKQVKKFVHCAKLLSGLPVFLELEILRLVFFLSVKKTERFTIFFAVFAVVYVVGVNHPLQVHASVGWAPLDTLMNNDIVKYQIENSVTQNT